MRITRGFRTLIRQAIATRDPFRVVDLRFPREIPLFPLVNTFVYFRCNCNMTRTPCVSDGDCSLDFLPVQALWSSRLRWRVTSV